MSDSAPKEAATAPRKRVEPWPRPLILLTLVGGGALLHLAGVYLLAAIGVPDALLSGGGGALAWIAAGALLLVNRLLLLFLGPGLLLLAVVDAAITWYRKRAQATGTAMASPRQ